MEFFPFEKVRPEQNKLIADIKNAVENKKNIIAHAPTGLGKTAAALTPLIEFAEKNNLNIFFLTSRNAQHNLIMETLQSINKKTKVNSVDFIGKKHMCPKVRQYNQRELNFFDFCKNLRKNKECELYLNSFQKAEHSKQAKDFAKKIIENGPANVEKIVELTKNKFCTYEISILLAKEARVFVGDYFHVFDPSIQKHLFQRIGKELSKTILVIDEAHNLPDRIRNDWTLQLNTFLLKNLADKLKKQHYNDFANIILKIKDELKNYASDQLFQENEVYANKQDFVSIIEEASKQNYTSFLNDFSKLSDEIEEREEYDEFTRFAMFLKFWVNFDKGFARILRTEKTKSGKTFPSLEFCCLDPSIITKPLFDEAYSSILMSGTLLPGEMYRDILGFEPEETEIKVYKNPFPRKNKLVLTSSSITTKYSERSEEMFKRIAASCAYLINSVNGNSAVFFPSYSFMSKTLFYLTAISKKKLFVEKQGMTQQEREELISKFKSNVINGGSALLGVQGANFSEGIDLPGELLKGVAIVGVPLAPPNLRQKSLIDYFENKLGKGWDYGYVFPAINRALQAAGRCIRSEKDTGIIAFLDKRFLWDKYRKIIPPDWEMKPTDDLRTEIRNFFNEN